MRALAVWPWLKPAWYWFTNDDEAEREFRSGRTLVFLGGIPVSLVFPCLWRNGKGREYPFLQATSTTSYSPSSAYPLLNTSSETRYGCISSFLNCLTWRHRGLQLSRYIP